MKDEPIKKCIKCGGKVKKLIGAGAGIIFKGSGFYSTDHKSPSGQGRMSGSHSEEKSDSSESKSADTKPAPKPAETTASSDSN